MNRRGLDWLDWKMVFELTPIRLVFVCSGKTFTIEGKSGTDYDTASRGLAPRTIEDVFTRVGLMKQNRSAASTSSSEEWRDIHINVSMYEIYMGRIQDLLRSAASAVSPCSSSVSVPFVPQKVSIQEDKNQKLLLVGLSSTRVTNAADAVTLFRTGASRRIVAPTAANQDSSRSHSVFELTLQIVFANGRTQTSKIRLLDLAGSG